MLDPLTSAVPYLRTVAGVLGRRWGINPAELVSEAWLRMLAERSAIEGAADPAAAAKVVAKRAMWAFTKRERRAARRCHTPFELRTFAVAGRELEPVEAIDEFDVLLQLARPDDRALLTARFRDGLAVSELAADAEVHPFAIRQRIGRAVRVILDRIQV